MTRWPPFPVEPARGARTARFFGGLGLLVMAVAVGCRHLDLVSTETVIVSFALVLVFALVGLGFVLRAFRDIWDDGRTGAAAAFGSFALCILTLTPFAGGIVAWSLLPPLADVATSRDDPPALDPTVGEPSLLPAFGLLAPAIDAARLQTEAYPDLRTRRVDLSTVESFALVRQAVDDLGWRIASLSEPDVEGAEGRLAAVTRSWTGFPDDVVIRVRAGAGGSAIDLRSASRYPLPDLGENARHIRAFLEAFGKIAGRPG